MILQKSKILIYRAQDWTKKSMFSESKRESIWTFVSIFLSSKDNLRHANCNGFATEARSTLYLLELTHGSHSPLTKWTWRASDFIGQTFFMETLYSLETFSTDWTTNWETTSARSTNRPYQKKYNRKQSFCSRPMTSDNAS